MLEKTLVKEIPIRKLLASDLVGLLDQSWFGLRHCQIWRELNGCCEEKCWKEEL